MPKSKRHSAEVLPRFAAKLLFQFRVGPAKARQRRLIEERILVLHAADAEAAWAGAIERGEQEAHFYRNDDGDTVHFEFVGLLDLQHLGPECAEDEVWYDIRRMTAPMERRRTLIPPKSRLSAFLHQDP